MKHFVLLVCFFVTYFACEQVDVCIRFLKKHLGHSGKSKKIRVKVNHKIIMAPKFEKISSIRVPTQNDILVEDSWTLQYRCHCIYVSVIDSRCGH
jgi:hypothetical protein